MDTCKVVLADEHAIPTQDTSSLLSEDDFIDLVDIASAGKEHHKWVEDLHPDILVSEIVMTDKSISDISEEISQKICSPLSG